MGQDFGGSRNRPAALLAPESAAGVGDAAAVAKGLVSRLAGFAANGTTPSS